MLDTYIHIYALYEVTPSTKRDNEGKNGGERGKPRQKLMDWMMANRYRKLEEKAQQWEEWSRWTFGQKADNLKKRRRKEDEESVRSINEASLCSSCILVYPSPLSFWFNFWLYNEKFIEIGRAHV